MTRTNWYQRKVVGLYLIQHRETLRSYCGQSRDVLSRWKSHCSGGKKAVGIGAAIRDEGVDSFTFRVLEECSVSQLNEREVFWIEHYDCVEPHGWNRNSGGGAPTYVSEKTKQKLSAAGKGKNTGKTASLETKAKMSALRKGVPHSPETREKIGAALKGKALPPETREKMRAASTGVTHSLETREKMRAAKLGNISTKGKTRSPEAIAASVEGRRRAKAARAAAAETSSYSEPLLEALQSLRTDKQYVAMDSGSTPPSASPSPTLEELDALLKEWEGL